eukprot:TRINITY_DN18061_c0_g1_i1.p3 TRINITY_DN18061_c0_g1~~TRINITY_DN18061_c0_g1_i1.p3  ORF type:complete len:108 (-),score=16.24 TRINITY_DN18061_c0_g1_i1:50-373(-)
MQEDSMEKLCFRDPKPKPREAWKMDREKRGLEKGREQVWRSWETCVSPLMVVRAWESESDPCWPCCRRLKFGSALALFLLFDQSHSRGHDPDFAGISTQKCEETSTM